MIDDEAAMRDHPFVGDGPYCLGWGPTTSRMTAEGQMKMRSQCGWSREMHPEEVKDDLLDGIEEFRPVYRTVVRPGLLHDMHTADYYARGEDQ